MGSESRARLGLAALLLVTLAAFEQLFARSDYFGPALLGLLLAAGIAMGGRRLGIGTAVTLEVSAAALFWYLTLVFEASRTFYGLPTPAAAAGLAASVRSAIAASSLDFAPIPSRAGYVVLIVTGIWAATTVAEIATFRWRRPLLATAPALGLFAYSLIVADPAGESFRVAVWLAALLTYLGLESSHRLSTWGRYIATWRDKAPEPDPVTGMLARRMGAACVLAALVSPLFLPAIEDGVLAWRSPTGTGGGPGGIGGAGGRIDLLATLVPEALRQSDAELFEVEARRPAKWRLASLSRFDGTAWQPGDGERQSAAIGFAAPLSPDVPASSLEQRVRILDLDGDYLPAAATPTGLEFVGDPGADVAEVTLDPETYDLQYSGVGSGLTYEVTSLVPRLTYRALARASIGNPGPEYEVPPSLSEEVRSLRERWIRGAEGPFEELVAIQNRLRGPAFVYSENVDASATTDYLTTFLTDTRAGFCQQFAAAFAVLARSLGYPTRLSIGFLPGEVGEEADRYTVRGTDAHAWPEVHFEGYGWVAFEPTPRSTSLAPDYTSAPVNVGGPISGQVPGGPQDGGQVSGQARIRNEVLEPRPPLVPPPAPETATWQRAFRRLSTVVLLALAAWLVAVPGLKAWRWRRRYRRAVTPRSAVVTAFEHFVAEASELATAPRPPSESAVAYARRIAPSEGGPVSPATDLALLYERAEYGPQQVSPADAVAARHLARLLRSRLWARASWWERAVRLFGPSGLLDSGARTFLPRAPRPRAYERAA